jgi:hypothetical protein
MLSNNQAAEFLEKSRVLLLRAQMFSVNTEMRVRETLENGKTSPPDALVALINRLLIDGHGDALALCPAPSPKEPTPDSPAPQRTPGTSAG